MTTTLSATGKSTKRPASDDTATPQSPPPSDAGYSAGRLRGKLLRGLIAAMPRAQATTAAPKFVVDYEDGPQGTCGGTKASVERRHGACAEP
jgi:hypothetical protein